MPGVVGAAQTADEDAVEIHVVLLTLLLVHVVRANREHRGCRGRGNVIDTELDRVRAVGIAERAIHVVVRDMRARVVLVVRILKHRGASRERVRPGQQGRGCEYAKEYERADGVHSGSI
jgi:hypothetical protein